MPSNNVQDAWDPQLPEDSHDGDLTDSHEPLSSRILRSSFASIIAALPQVPGYENTDAVAALDQSRSDCEVARSTGSFPLALFHRPQTDLASRPSDVAASAPAAAPAAQAGALSAPRGDASGATTDRAGGPRTAKNRAAMARKWGGFKPERAGMSATETSIEGRSMSAPAAVLVVSAPPVATSPRAHRVSTDEYTSSIEDPGRAPRGSKRKGDQDGKLAQGAAGAGKPGDLQPSRSRAKHTPPTADSVDSTLRRNTVSGATHVSHPVAGSRSKDIRLQPTEVGRHPVLNAYRVLRFVEYCGLDFAPNQC